jgi:hypothetical protein
MKKVILSLAVICIAGASAFAQGRFSVGAEVALPQGDWSDFVGVGIGGSVRYESAINDNLSWMGTAGYISFAEKDDSGLKFSMIPVQAGLKYYFNESFNGFYGAAELGITFAKAEFAGVSASDSEFGFAPSVGYHLGNIDISARYQIISDANYLGFRVAYVFGGK